MSLLQLSVCWRVARRERLVFAIVLCWSLASAIAADALDPGDHTRSLSSDDRKRSYLVHVPPKYDPKTPTPVVLILHGAGTDATITVPFTGMSRKSDEAGFIAVYPNGTGIGPFQTWNAGGLSGLLAEGKPDDVAFISKLLDDLATVVNVDAKRVYVTGISNGGMMAYKLAAELSDRIAAIAPVAGTMTMDTISPRRPVPVMHFHGTKDTFVPFNGPSDKVPKFIRFKSVEETIAAWAKANGCPAEPQLADEPNKVDDGTKVQRKTYGPGTDGAEVILWTIEGGGHTWPGMKAPVNFIGKSTQNISANDLMWEFFEKHPLK